MRFSGGELLSTGGPGFNLEGGEKREKGERTLGLIPPTPDTHTPQDSIRTARPKTLQLPALTAYVSQECCLEHSDD